jgi:YD repeat-containing protein
LKIAQQFSFGGVAMKKVMASLFALAVIHGVLSERAAAQVGNNCTDWANSGSTSLWPDGQYSPLPPGVFDCVGIQGAFEVVCRIPNFLCPPAASQQETCGCNTSQSVPGGGSPISLVSGNTFIVETDLRIPGLGGGLTLSRDWNSLWPPTQTAYQVGLFGPNWRSNFEERVFLGADNYMKYARRDGTFWSFGWGGAGNVPGWSVAAPANQAATLVQGPSYWTITFQNGEQRLFDNTSGKLISIIDRNGNTTQLTYDAVGRLTTVTDPASRQLNFSYANGSSLLVVGVTSSTGMSSSYSYDAQGRLIQVTNPDTTFYTFQYNSQSLISSVTDQNGKILEAHTYDSSGRGLTSSRANGVEAVTISYGSN